MSSPISALYYSEQSTAFSQVLRPQSAKEAAPLAHPAFPTYRTSVPAYGMNVCDLFYSEAPLEGVMRVQSCYDTGRCIGLLLDYEKCSQTVGHFRHDKEVSDYFQRPQSIGLTHEQHHSAAGLHVKFSRQSPLLDRAVDSCMRPMRGTIVWWYSADMCDVSIVV
jgi:hypothetical protein